MQFLEIQELKRKMNNNAGFSSGERISRAQAGIARGGERDVLMSSIRAAIAIKNLVRSSLGPRAMGKLLVTAKGDIAVTSDGSTILERVPVKNPVVKIMVDAVKAHYTELGDGTKTMTILIGELLERAASLLSMKLHPTALVTGYKMACDKALQILDEIAVPIEFHDTATLKKIAISSMSSTVICPSTRDYARITIEAIRNIIEKTKGKPIAKVEEIKLVKKAGQGLSQTQLIKGLIIEKPILHKDMPKRVENPKIALLDYSLDLYKHRLNAEIQVNASRIKNVVDESISTIKSWVEKIRASGANVVICQKTVSEKARYYLAGNGIMGVHEVKLSDMERLAKATGGRIVHTLDTIKPEDLGIAGLAEERKLGEEKLLFIERCKGPKSLSILIRGGLEKSTDEAERVLRHSLYALSNVVKKDKIVAGGGAVEAEIAIRLRDYARQVRGREQLAVQCFAEAVEIIPKTLAESAGLTPLDVIADLRSRHGDGDGLWVGVNVFSRKIGDMMEKGVIEPVCLKEQTIKSAVEVASMILTVSKVIIKPRFLSPEEKRQGIAE